MPRLDLSGYLDDDCVEVPGIPSEKFPGGKTYKFKSPNAKTGLLLASLADLGLQSNQGVNIGAQVEKLNLDDDQEKDLFTKVMRETLTELVEDGVSWVRIQKLGRYLFIYFAMGEEVASVMAQRLGEASAPPNRAVRRAAAAKKTTPKTPRVSPAG